MQQFEAVDSNATSNARHGRGLQLLSNGSIQPMYLRREQEYSDTSGRLPSANVRRGE